MKPLFALFLRRDSFQNSNGELTAFVEFGVKFDDSTIKKYKIYTDIDFQEAKSSTYDATESLQAHSELTNWLIILFNTWKEALNKGNDSKMREDLFYFRLNGENDYSCKINENYAGSQFSNAYENKSSNSISEAWNGCVASTSSFFKPVEDVPYYQANRIGSTLTNEQIDRIETHINELEKEMRSFWQFNKERKGTKIEELKHLIEMSKHVDAHKAISTILENSEVSAGYLSTRTYDLLVELQKEAYSRQNVGIESSCL